MQLPVGSSSLRGEIHAIWTIMLHNFTQAKVCDFCFEALNSRTQQDVPYNMHITQGNEMFPTTCTLYLAWGQSG